MTTLAPPFTVPAIGIIGRHFTGAANWERIEYEGLRPYLLRAELAPFYTTGVMVWPEPDTLDGEIGSVLWQAEKKGTLTVVQLAIEVRPSDVMPPRVSRPGDSVAMTHSGEFADGTPFHAGKPFIILQAIPPERVWLEACYTVPIEALLP